MDGQYSFLTYVLHKAYAPDATHYLRAYSILQEDLLRLFEFVEPADANEGTYSYRCLEILLRACGEVEANCKAIFNANRQAADKLTIVDYRKLNATHRLSSFKVRLPVWTGQHRVRTPFEAWPNNPSPAWFQAHHGGKHNRHAEFPNASLQHAVDAVAGVTVLLAAQFVTYDFKPVLGAISTEADDPEWKDAIGGYFQVRFPTDWPDSDRYEFDWHFMNHEADPFRQLPL